MLVLIFFFRQAEDGIRGADVTGVQTCALPISRAPPPDDPVATGSRRSRRIERIERMITGSIVALATPMKSNGDIDWERSEERRVGNERRTRCAYVLRLYAS